MNTLTRPTLLLSNLIDQALKTPETYKLRCYIEMGKVEITT